MIDLHSHILPGLDDGARSFEEAISMAGIAVAEGIHDMVATPHYTGEEMTEAFYSRVLQQRDQLDGLLKEAHIDLKIYIGAEAWISPFLISKGDVHSLCLNGSRYLLVELPMMDMPQYTEAVIYQLQLKGIVPVIAHPERNQAIIRDPNLLGRLIDLGAIAQANTGSILGKFGLAVQKCARILLEHDMIHALGTDAHSDRTRSPRWKECLPILEKWFGCTKAEAILHTVPQTILQDRTLELPPPREYRRRRSLFSWRR